MNKQIAVLGRQPLISVAELEALFGANVRIIARSKNSPWLAEFEADRHVDIRKLGGILKVAEPIEMKDFLASLPAEGKITLGVSDFSKKTSASQAQKSALTLKKMLVKQGRSVRVVPNQTAVLSSAVSLHNHLFRENKIELLKLDEKLYKVTQASNPEGYARRDQKRPARDAKVGMLPPKLAQILINLCGELPERARVLDPFCGTGVVLQEALLMGYRAYGTDVNERMVEYSERNLKWLEGSLTSLSRSSLRVPVVTGPVRSSSAVASHDLEKLASVPSNHRKVSSGNTVVQVGDATSFQWEQPIDAVACETYLGSPMSNPPAEIKLKDTRQLCGGIIRGFLKNLAGQIKSGTPVVIAVPAWLRPDGTYTRLFGEKLVDEMENLRYNVSSFKNLGQNDLLYHREGQVVAREIIVLRKK